jgi:hypothetical protein
MGERNKNFALQSIFVHTCKWFFLHAVEFYMRLPTTKEGVPRIFIALKSTACLGRFEPANFGSNDKHANHYTTEATTAWFRYSVRCRLGLQVIRRFSCSLSWPNADNPCPDWAFRVRNTFQDVKAGAVPTFTARFPSLNPAVLSPYCSWMGWLVSSVCCTDYIFPIRYL